jgi:acyl-CoA reductase-like NAD-dependent aldehyde dehydrogenase
VITGFGNISGSVLSHHMDVRALTFTGSTRTGRLIQEAASKSNLKLVLLELGGKSPAIVFEDADLDVAVADTQFSIQTNSGQMCMAMSRVYVQDTVAKKFTELFKEKLASSAIMGDATHPKTNHGPQVDQIQHESVRRYIEAGKGEATLVLGEEQSQAGYFVKPTIFVNAPEDARIVKEEIFGPVVVVNTFSTEEEVMMKANDSEYGLYASVYTKNLDQAMRFVRGLEAGTVSVNCTSPTTMRDMPFGGYKGSGIGREGLLCSMDNFLETKSVLIKTS